VRRRRQPARVAVQVVPVRRCRTGGYFKFFGGRDDDKSAFSGEEQIEMDA
jgi:hypothetical protein